MMRPARLEIRLGRPAGLRIGEIAEMQRGSRCQRQHESRKREV